MTSDPTFSHPPSVHTHSIRTRRKYFLLTRIKTNRPTERRCRKCYIDVIRDTECFICKARLPAGCWLVVSLLGWYDIIIQNVLKVITATRIAKIWFRSTTNTTTTKTQLKYSYSYIYRNNRIEENTNHKHETNIKKFLRINLQYCTSKGCRQFNNLVQKSAQHPKLNLKMLISF